jgi:hypothetical protein
MPKRPRQAHIPQQAKRRKARRPAGESTATVADQTKGQNGSLTVDDEAVFADPPVMPEPALIGTGPVATAPRSGRRLSTLRGTAPAEQATTGPARAVPGQLPTFERAYLMRELRQIAAVSSFLLALIVALTIILR